MANIAQSVNVISPLMTSKTGIVKQTTWWPWLLFCQHMRGTTLQAHLQSGEYEGTTNEAWLRGKLETPWLDVSAAINDEGWVSLVVVNIHDKKTFSTKVDGIPKGVKVDVYTVTGESLDVTNTAEKTNVEVKESKWEATETYHFPKASMTMLRWKP
jgi:alpha-N-arabinofuranosidase